MRQMSDTLANAHAFSFTTTEVLEGVRATGEKRTSHFFRKVTLRRPNGLFLELHGSGGTKLEVAAYYDGKTVSLESDARKVWAQTDVPGTLDEMLDDVARRYSLPLPIADVVYSSLYDAVQKNSSPIESLASFGEKTIQLPKGWQYRTRTLTEDQDWSLVPTKRSTPSGTSSSNKTCGSKKPFDTGDVRPPIEVSFEPDGGCR